jgi:hypothetical protein
MPHINACRRIDGAAGACACNVPIHGTKPTANGIVNITNQRARQLIMILPDLDAERFVSAASWSNTAARYTVPPAAMP